jgi:signal transduction histidine kinase
MKVINQILTSALGSEHEFTFEERLVFSYVLYAILSCFFSIFFNEALGLSANNVLIIIISFLFFSLIFVLGRVFKRTSQAKLLFAIYCFFFCNFYWYINYGSRGSATYVFLIYFFIIIFFWDNLHIWIIGLLILLNVVILFIIEMVKPEVVPFYPTEHARIVDSYSTLIIVLGFFSIIIISAKNNYIKQYKLAQQSDRLKSAFLANMSHEIRTPLNAIMGFTQLLATRELSKDKRELYAGLVTKNSKYLLQLVSDILDISLIETGQLKVRKRMTDLSDIFTKLYHTFLKVLEDMDKINVQLVMVLPLKPVTVEVDDIRLEQVLSNLLSNAIKYTTEGSVKFGYTLMESGLLIYVEDTGCGIKEEFQPYIFSRFLKNENMSDDNFARGAGIGLSLSKELVQILNGKIWFVSEYKKGSTFYVSIPHKILSIDGIIPEN